MFLIRGKYPLLRERESERERERVRERVSVCFKMVGCYANILGKTRYKDSYADTRCQ